MDCLYRLKDGRPYEIFTGIDDEEEGISIPKRIVKGKIIGAYDADGTKHYDFQFSNRRGIKSTVEGLDTKFNPEFKLRQAHIWRAKVRNAHRAGGELG